nr:hypothetical protein [Tanacetum cinerariifolium]
MDGEVMINSIKNGDQPLPRVTQVSIAGTSSTEQPSLKDKSMWSDQEKRIQKIDHLVISLLIQGLPNDIYSLIDSNKTAKDLWDALARHMLGYEYGEQDRKAKVLYEYETFKATEGELLLNTYIRYLQVINDLKKCGYLKYNCELNFKFLNNLQPKWKHFDCEEKKVSKRKEKVVVSLDSEGSDTDDFSELKKITLLAKAFNTRKFYSKPTNNNLRTSSASQSANKKQEYVKSDDKKLEKKDDEKNDSDQEINANMVFTAQIEKVLSDSEASSSFADDKISEKCGYSKDNYELNFKFLNNLQPEWKQYATMMRQNKNLMDINIDALYNILKQNQGDVNDAMGSKKKTIVVTYDPLALIAKKTNVSRSKEKVVVSLDYEGSEADDFNDKKVEKKADEKKRDMSRVKCYNCKKEGHFTKDCKKANVKDYEYYKTKMLLAKKDKDEQVFLAKDQAWMESSSDSNQEINANMVFMAQIEKVLSDSEASSSSADEKISETIHMIMPSKDNLYNGRKGIVFENPSYFEKAKDLRPTLYDEKKKIVVVTSDPLALIADKTKVSRSKEKVVVSSNSEGSEADDFSELKKITAFNSDQEINANIVFMAQIKKVLSCSEASSSSADEKSSELKELIEKNNDLLAQTKLLKEQLQVKHVVIDAHVECQKKYAKLGAERYEYMIRYSAYFDNDKQHRKQIADQQVFFDKMSVQMVELDKHVRDLKNMVLEKDFKISKLEECVRNKDLEIEKCLECL